MDRRFAVGEAVAVRYITPAGRPGMSWPYRVVQDSDDLVALFIPAGALHKRWAVVDGVRQLADQPWRRDTLRLMFPGALSSVWLHWKWVDGQRVFESYYVNMEEPFRRSPIGFDTNDHMLDVVVAPDLSWEWKDEDVLADRLAQGFYSEEFAAAVRSEGERVIGKLERRESPFGGDWAAWTPDPAWAIPELPAGWDTIEPILWEGRAWAYIGQRPVAPSS